MAKIFITGSSDGLGLLAAKLLVAQGHQVVLHARNEARKQETTKLIKGYESILVGDLTSLEQTKLLAARVNSLGKFDAVIHNAGVYNASAHDIFTVNVLAPYVLTWLIEKPKRLVYLSSAMHLSGRSNLENLKKNSANITYSDSKLYIMMLCKAVARKWPDVFSNAVNPGWVPTKMGGKGAPDDLKKGAETQVWLATSNDTNAKVSGNYFFHKQQAQYNPESNNETLQARLIELCEEKSGIR